MKKSADSLQRCILRPRPYVCTRCQQERFITMNFLKKKEEGRQQWADRAKEIRAGTRKSMLEIMKERGYVHAIAGDEKAVDRLMIDKRIGVYLGVDPTARSLHVGHMVAFMPLFWMYAHGFHAVTLIGGSTARIGDPTGRTTDRPDMTPTERKANIAAIHYQLKRLWVQVEKMVRKHGFQPDVHWHRDIINNAVWWNKLTFIEVLRMLGKGLRLGTMLGRDTVKTKMESGDGMSFSEFCYPLMQSWDWWHMYEERGIQMQLGGSDQFGNIVAGMDAIKYIVKTHPNLDVRQKDGVQDLTAPCGITVPLLTTSSGAKFGKSAGNAIWLDQEMTNVFDLYGFFIRTADTDVERYLKLFTFLPLNQIQSLMDQHKLDQSKRIPHHKLAFEFVELVHGKQFAEAAEKQHRTMFGKHVPEDGATGLKVHDNVSQFNPLMVNQNATKREEGTFYSNILNKYAVQANAGNSPLENIVLPKSLIHGQPIARILHAAGLVSSRSEGHRLASAGGAYVAARYAKGSTTNISDSLNFIPCKVHDFAQAWKWVIRDDDESRTMHKEGEEGILILRVGKWKVRVVRIVSDEKYDQIFPEEPQVWREFKAQRVADRLGDASSQVAQDYKNQAIDRVRGVASDAAENESDDAVESHMSGSSGRYQDYSSDNASVRAHQEPDETPPNPTSTQAEPSRPGDANHTQLRREYGMIRDSPTEQRTPSPSTKRAHQWESAQLQHVQGQLVMEKRKLHELTRAARMIGYKPDVVPDEHDPGHRFVAFNVENQQRQVKRLEGLVAKQESKVSGMGSPKHVPLVVNVGPREEEEDEEEELAEYNEELTEEAENKGNENEPTSSSTNTDSFPQKYRPIWNKNDPSAGPTSKPGYNTGHPNRHLTGPFRAQEDQETFTKYPRERQNEAPIWWGRGQVRPEREEKREEWQERKKRELAPWQVKMQKRLMWKEGKE